MPWIDIVIVVIIATSALISLFRGFIREFLSLLTWVVAIWLAVSYAGNVAAWLPDSLEQASLNLGEASITIPKLRVGFAFVIILFGILIVGAIIGRVVARLVGGYSLGLTDRGFGMLFGMLRGGVIVSIFVMISGLTSFPKTPWWHESHLIPPFQEGALWFIGYFPSRYADYFSYQ